MEGTRNERVIILITSYIIGFLTAYIAFGVINLEEEIRFVYVPTQQTAAVAASDTPDVRVYVNETGLIFDNGQEQQVVSALSIPTEGAALAEGDTVVIVNYSLSKDSQYVYFCEQPSLSAQSCIPYVYSVAENTLHPVTVEGERVAFDSATHDATWNTQGRLIADNYASVDSSTPWEL